MIKKIFTNTQAVIALIIILSILLIAFFAPVFTPNDPNLIDLTNKYHSSSSEFPLGCDSLGRCELSRLLYGARYSILISLPTLFLMALIGLLLGTLSACASSKVDRVITAICDIFISFPSLIIAVAVIGILGNGIQNLMIAMVISMWAWFTRMVRSYSLTEMGKDYILAAKISGCKKGKLIFKHLIPNIMPQFLVYLSTGVASSILTVSGFAFLGLGLPTGTSEWGAMLNDARSCLYSNPQLLIYPGICIVLAAAGFNLFGEALRDIMDIQENNL